MRNFVLKVLFTGGNKSGFVIKGFEVFLSGNAYRVNAKFLESEISRSAPLIPARHLFP